MNILKHENVIKGTTMGMGNVKYIYIFYIFESHHGNAIIWIVNFVFEIGYITCKVSTTKNWCKLMMLQKSFCMFKTFKFLFWTFKKFQTFIFYINCAPFLFKIEEYFILMIKLTTWVEIGENSCLQHILMNMLLIQTWFYLWNLWILKISLTKIIHFYVVRAWLHNIQNIVSRNNKKIFISSIVVIWVWKFQNLG